MDTGKRAPVLGAVRLPDLQLFAAGAGAAPVLVQQPDGRVPALRRARQHHLFRSRSASSPSRICPSAPAPSRAGTGATSSTSRCCRPGAALRLRSGSAVREPARADAGRGAVRLAGARRSASPIRSERGQTDARASPSRASSPTWSGATRRPIRRSVREELAKYLNTQPCPECDGTRLRREARHVRVGGPDHLRHQRACR